MKIQGLNIFKLMEILPNHEKKKEHTFNTFYKANDNTKSKQRQRVIAGKF